MARRRMFSLDVVDTDRFLNLPVSSQSLYFHLGMRADDDGFITSMRKIIAFTGCTNDDLRQLIDSGFVIAFDTGVYAIRDWKISNYIQSDRYHQTVCRSEKEQLEIMPTGAYRLRDADCIQPVYKTDTEDRIELGEGRKGKQRPSTERIQNGNSPYTRNGKEGKKPVPTADLSPISEDEIAHERKMVDLLQSYGIRATPRDTQDAHDLIDQYGREAFEKAADIAMQNQKASIPYIRGILKNGGGTRVFTGDVGAGESPGTGGTGADRREKARWHVSNCV